MAASNYDDILSQLQSNEFDVSVLEIGVKKRVKLVGKDKEKRAWYHLHEIRTDGGEYLLIGAAGIFHADQHIAIKLTYPKQKNLTSDQQAAIKHQVAESKKRAEAEDKRKKSRAADTATRIWQQLSESGDCDYLTRKRITPHGVKFSPSGALYIPLMDGKDRIHGLQVIFDSTKHANLIKRYDGKDKRFFPEGLDVSGHYFLIGDPGAVIIITEGYATAESIHMATGLCVVVAFNAGNLKPVARAIHTRYPRANLLIAGDDDAFGQCQHCKTRQRIDASTHCQSGDHPHGKKNTGAISAELAAISVNGRYLLPKFVNNDERLAAYIKSKTKITDFNDLHQAQGLDSVSEQIQTAIAEFGWQAARKPRDEATGGGGGASRIKSISTASELIRRFALIVGKNRTVFDFDRHELMSITDMCDLTTDRQLYDAWKSSRKRLNYGPEHVGFDPAGEDKSIICNLWSGWPTEPRPGKCDLLLESLLHMCSAEKNTLELAEWVLKWLAYPLQNPGAKMRTTVVVHGPQGTGKNVFFESIMEIYGRYGRIVDQASVESQFNDWASGKLFLIADEVVARSDVYHIKNKLKGLVTGRWIRINTKNLSAFDEQNHVNMVFLSNERMPVVLEEDDRRHCVIWTPAKKPPDFYKNLGKEIADGGVAALHAYLLGIDLSGFNEFSEVPQTDARSTLIDLSKDNVLRFYDDWQAGELPNVPLVPALTDHIYTLYRGWCGRQGVKPVPLNRAIDALSKRPGASKERKRYLVGIGHSNPKFFLFPPFVEQRPVGATESESAWLGSCVERMQTAIEVAQL